EFERAYTRFLDLKQAEAQAREAQIELGLERVRARAMAMQNSGELNDLVAILFEELTRLDLILARCIIWIFDIDTLSARLWMANSEDKKAAESYYIKRLQHSYYESIIRGWKERNPKWVYDLKGEEKKTIDQLLLNETELSRLPDAVKNGILNAAHTIVSGSFNNFGLLEASGPVELSGEQMDIVSRFAKVFDLTYTRFNDLKQAEAQAREAQIELGLERVRARAMAMQKSDELKELIGTVSTELSKLDIVLDRCFIMTYDIKTLGVTWWMANPETSSDPIGLYVKYHEQVPYLAFLKAWQDRIVKWQFILEGSVKKTWDEFLFVETELSRLPGFVIDNMRANEKVYLSASFNNFGCLTLATLEPLSDEQFDIMLRFAKVFDLTYTRFNDLKQAEAQAREAQIELGLEKVRAKAMAMHKSDDLKTAVATVFEELNKLDLGLIRCGIAILDKNQPRGDIWITLKSGQHSTIEVSGDEPLDIHPLLKGAYDGWLKQEDFSYTLQDEDLVSYYQAITKTNFQQSVSATFKTEKKDQQQYYFNAVFQDGSIFAFLNTAFTDEAKTVMRRFANVFNLTYKRFLDLQKAEAQAREARIETALEKIRASTMAMQRSEDLSQTAFVLFKQFKELGAEPERIFIATFDDHDSGVIDLWGTDQGGNQLNKLFKVPVNEPTMVSKIVAAWKEKKKSVVVDLKGEELKTYLGFLKQAGIPVTEGIMTDRRVQTAACFSNGVIGVTTSEPQSAEAVQLQERFAGVFDLTYTRFLDLQKAEAQAREAKIETALERVRARALAMQEPEELKEVAQVLRTEMGLLGVEELETCSIYINDESAEKAECWYALKDIRSEEKKLVNDHFALDLNDTWVGREMLHFYQSSNKQISIVMQGENRKEWIRYCEKHSTPLGGYYGEMIPDRTYHLYKFSHGAIGAAAAGDISEESWRMLSRAASVFSLAYSRFKDLTQARTDLIKLKEEKKRAEEALTELQATQKQLIQSEKMASLGELTAGIAHEIQNPLNFVNNFSDVSNELLEEMKTELEKGNAAEAREIAINVKENLEKILHHGKRADAIVKGMLQHSRSSGGQKELTDINTLAEEYLRLAYHGLRAKDKFFNAKFETDLDRSISKINVVPQEIGRVILNLINNSFYAVSEKKRGVSNGYEPSVTVSTKKINDKVEIRVKDNGNGISQKDLDKIFQPFFTTKPTGQGTGLGLSLSYDIITKGHGGEIKVETKEGEGSEFTITLPMN
ncbi:MAG TPA: ATP-binding protein, partial [Chitinophagaceae bacterium]